MSIKRNSPFRIPEIWVVLLPLVLAVTMGAITLGMALSHPDAPIERNPTLKPIR